MELLPTSDDHDVVAGRVRTFAAARLVELIDGLQPFVAEALRDPSDLVDVEPSRVMANVAVVKLQAAMIKQLGGLYQVDARPVERPDVNLVPMEKVQELLELERQEAVVRTGEAVAAAVAAVREEFAVREVLSLEAARSNLTAALSRLNN